MMRLASWLGESLRERVREAAHDSGSEIAVLSSATLQTYVHQRRGAVGLNLFRQAAVFYAGVLCLATPISGR